MEVFAVPKVKEEYERCVRLVGEDDPYRGSYVLGLHDVLRAHFLIADFFYASGEGIGGIGPKNIQLLHSALARQQVGFESKTKWHDIFDICATLMYGLIMNHPFHDANKRTAFLSALLYLYRHKRTPDIPHDKFENLTVEIADHQLHKYRRYVEYREKFEDPEIRFISHFLKKNTREMDKRHYTITYNDLNRILRRFKFGLENPNNNYINIVKYKTEVVGLLKKRELTVTQRVAQIGFPGWTKQVNPGAISTVREKTGLTYENGFDSQVFFHGLEDTQELIAYYQEPLKRLAYR